MVAGAHPSGWPLRICAVVHRRNLRGRQRSSIRQRVCAVRPLGSLRHRTHAGTRSNHTVLDDLRQQGRCSAAGEGAQRAHGADGAVCGCGVVEECPDARRPRRPDRCSRSGTGADSETIQRVCGDRRRHGLRPRRHCVRPCLFGGLHRSYRSTKDRFTLPLSVSPTSGPKVVYVPTQPGGCSKPTVRRLPGCTRRATRWQRPAGLRIPAVETRSERACCSVTWLHSTSRSRRRKDQTAGVGKGVRPCRVRRRFPCPVG